LGKDFSISGGGGGSTFSNEFLPYLFLFVETRYPEDSKIALYSATERKGKEEIKTQTFGQLRDRVARYAAGKC